MEAADARGEAARLIASQRWLALGTVDRNGLPSVTYAPFAVAGGAFVVVVSALAVHAANLAANPAASIMLVGDDGADAYSRTRLTVAVSVGENAAGSPAADAIWSALETRQGETVQVPRTLPDFRPLSLTPLRGRLVLGFASAHQLGGPALAELLRGLSG